MRLHIPLRCLLALHALSCVNSFCIAPAPPFAQVLSLDRGCHHRLSMLDKTDLDGTKVAARLLAPAILAVHLAFVPHQAYAQDAPRTGQQIFETKCAACHAGGQNSLNPAKTLTKEALKKYGYDTEEKVVDIISNGKAPMPKYAIKSKRLGLSPEEIQDTAKYVLQQAELGWK